MSPITGHDDRRMAPISFRQAVNLLQLTLPNGNFLIPTPQNTATGISSVTQNCTYNDDQFVTNVDYLINAAQQDFRSLLLRRWKSKRHFSRRPSRRRFPVSRRTSIPSSAIFR